MKRALEDQDMIRRRMVLQDHLPRVLVRHRPGEREPDMFQAWAGGTRPLLAESSVFQPRQDMTLNGHVRRGGGGANSR